MNIILSGSNSQINEWAQQCLSHGHTLYAFLNDEDVPLDERVQRYSVFNGSGIDMIVDLRMEDAETKAARLSDMLRHLHQDVSVLANTVLCTATELKKLLPAHTHLVGMAYMPSLLEGATVELSLSWKEGEEALSTVREFVGSLGKDAVYVEDYHGMVFPRIIATIVNEAVWALQHGVAEEDAIDAAMKLGVNYPEGPFAWGRKIGLGNILRLLQMLEQEYSDPRYRPAPLLKKMAG